MGTKNDGSNQRRKPVLGEAARTLQGQRFDRMRGEDRVAPVVVCGGGAAGMAAALSAARCGEQVCLVESSARLGGTVTTALIHTLAGLFDQDGEPLHRGLAVELLERLARQASAVRRRMGRLWVLSVCPNRYRRTTANWIEWEPRITVLNKSRVSRLTAEDGRIIDLEISTPDGQYRLAPKAIIDATGAAQVVRLIDPALVQRDMDRPLGGWIFRLRGVAPGTLDFPQAVGIVRALQNAVADGTLLPMAAGIWIDRGARPDEAFVKLSVPVTESDGGPGSESHLELTREMRQTQAAIVAFLRRMPGFSAAAVKQTGRPAARDAGRIHGEYCLSATDVRQSHKFDDAACRGCWPIEYWDMERGVSLEYLPEGDYYEIPLRSLKVKGFSNVWTAGKSLSADRLAQASARVAGTCWAMGEAVGKAAALAATLGEGIAHEPLQSLP
jgi:hypothetical protein